MGFSKDAIICKCSVWFKKNTLVRRLLKWTTQYACKYFVQTRTGRGSCEEPMLISLNNKEILFLCTSGTPVYPVKDEVGVAYTPRYVCVVLFFTCLKNQHYPGGNSFCFFVTINVAHGWNVASHSINAEYLPNNLPTFKYILVFHWNVKF